MVLQNSCMVRRLLKLIHFAETGVNCVNRLQSHVSRNKWSTFPTALMVFPRASEGLARLHCRRRTADHSRVGQDSQSARQASGRPLPPPCWRGRNARAWPSEFSGKENSWKFSFSMLTQKYHETNVRFKVIFKVYIGFQNSGWLWFQIGCGIFGCRVLVFK